MNLKETLYIITHWQTWHHQAKYIPISPVWIWYCLRAGNPWFFTPSNPTLTFGGFEGEGKQEMYEQLPPGSYPTTTYIEPDWPIKDVAQRLQIEDFPFPFIVKPDVGMMGLMFRKIDNIEELTMYHEAMPYRYLVQKLIDYPIEVAAFYYRMPNQEKGTVSGLLIKTPPQVVGDGKKTIRELIESNGAVAVIAKKAELISRHKARLSTVLANGEVFNLGLATNRSQGGTLLGIDHEIDEPLLQFFDNISHFNGNFFYGRYDIKCKSIEDLKAGKNYSILEFNGAGAGTQHIYANHYSLFKACRIILDHWKVLFQISQYNQKRGIKAWGFWDGWRHLKIAKKTLSVLQKKDRAFPVF